MKNIETAGFLPPLRYRTFLHLKASLWIRIQINAGSKLIRNILKVEVFRSDPRC
jgi:hypothetical protein